MSSVLSLKFSQINKALIRVLVPEGRNVYRPAGLQDSPRLRSGMFSGRIIHRPFADKFVQKTRVRE